VKRTPRTLEYEEASRADHSIPPRDVIRLCLKFALAALLAGTVMATLGLFLTSYGRN